MSIRDGRLCVESTSVGNTDILTVMEIFKRLKFGKKLGKPLSCEGVDFLAKYTKNELLRRSAASKISIKR